MENSICFKLEGRTIREMAEFIETVESKEEVNFILNLIIRKAMQLEKDNAYLRLYLGMNRVDQILGSVGG